LVLKEASFLLVALVNITNHPPRQGSNFRPKKLMCEEVYLFCRCNIDYTYRHYSSLHKRKLISRDIKYRMSPNKVKALAECPLSVGAIIV